MIATRRGIRLFCVAQSSICLGSTLAIAAPPTTSMPTAMQITFFANVVDDTPAAVSQRLQGDAALGPLVVSAADAHDERKRTGTLLVVAGGVVFGVSDVVGTLIILTTPGYPYIQSQDTGREVLGLAVALAGLGVGLGLAIPGVFDLAKKSDEERRAVEYYAPAPPTAPQPPAPIAPPGAPQPTFMLNVPLVSARF
jgi:hypothetical protein